MNYIFTCLNPRERILHIKTKWKVTPNQQLIIKCPSWIPYTYTLHSYEDHIQTFTITDKRCFILPFQKIQSNQWSVFVPSDGIIILQYTIHCFQISPWFSLVSSDTCVIQPGSICIFCDELKEQSCSISLNISSEFELISCKPIENNIEGKNIYFESYQQMIQNPILTTLPDLLYKTINKDFKLYWKGSHLISLEWITELEDKLKEINITSLVGFIYIIDSKLSIKTVQEGISYNSNGFYLVMLSTDNKTIFFDKLLHYINKSSYHYPITEHIDFSIPHYDKYLFLPEGLKLFLGIETIKPFLSKSYYKSKLNKYISSLQFYQRQTLLDDSIDIWKKKEIRNKAFIFWLILYKYISIQDLQSLFQSINTKYIEIESQIIQKIGISSELILKQLYNNIHNIQDIVKEAFLNIGFNIAITDKGMLKIL
jgi:hypothetical protein